jgi:hypothetical protein
LLDKPADVANRLAQPLFILHKCDTHKTFTVFVKGSTWSDCSLAEVLKKWVIASGFKQLWNARGTNQKFIKIPLLNRSTAV